MIRAVAGSSLPIPIRFESGCGSGRGLAARPHPLRVVSYLGTGGPRALVTYIRGEVKPPPRFEIHPDPHAFRCAGAAACHRALALRPVVKAAALAIAAATQVVL